MDICKWNHDPVYMQIFALKHTEPHKTNLAAVLQKALRLQKFKEEETYMKIEVQVNFTIPINSQRNRQGNLQMF